MKIRCERVGDRIAVDAPPTYKEIIKRLPGARYNNGWTVPLSWSSCLQLREELGEMLEVGGDLANWSWEHHAYRVRALEARAGVEEYQVGSDRLFDYQKIGAGWMLTTGRTLLCDEMGTGKTVQVAAVLQAMYQTGVSAFPALVVCPNSMKYRWQDELATWAPELSVQVVAGTATQRRNQLETPSDVYVINWEALRGHTKLSGYGSVELTEKERTPKELDRIGIQTIVADEAHKAVNPKAKQTRAFWNLSHQALFRFALTGTPIVNKPDDLWSIWYALEPSECAVKSKWVERYCLAGQGRFGWEIWGLRPERQSELFSLLDVRMLRRTKKEVLPQIPNKLPPQIRRVDMQPGQSKIYKNLKRDMMSQVEGDILVAGDPLTLAGRLTQAASGTPVMEGGEVVRLSTPSCKVDALLDVLEESNGESLVVFAASRLLIELCARELDKKKITYGLVTGAIDPALRTANIARFQAGDTQVILCTTGAGAEGITLTRAHRVLFLQRDWSHVKNLQAEDRVHRIGQDKEVEVITVVANGTIEEKVLQADATKEGYLQEVLRDELS